MGEFAYCVRRVEAQLKRVSNLYFTYFNRLKLDLLGVKKGKFCIVHGAVRLSLGKNADVSIGDNFCFLSGRTLNPLSRNLRGSICVNDNAQLIIGNHVSVSSVVLWSHLSITIGNHVDIGANTIIMDSDAHSLDYQKRRNIVDDLSNKNDSPIVIGDDVLIGANCIILKGVTIGNRSVVGAGAVVTKSIPDDCIAAGNPAKIIKDMRKNKTGVNINLGGVIRTSFYFHLSALKKVA